MMPDDRNYWRATRRARLSRRHLVAGGAAGIALAATACGKTGGGSGRQPSTSSGAQSGSELPQTGGILSVRLGTNPPTLDPHRTTSGPTEGLVGAIASRLLQYKTSADPRVAEDHQVDGDLALSVETPDALSWTVKLRPGAKFHNIATVNGHAVEAEDVKATFTRALDAKNPGRSALDMIDPAAIQTPSTDTVVFKLKYAMHPSSTRWRRPPTAGSFPARP